MSLQENTTEVKREQSFWLYPDLMSAWLIITVLILTMLGSTFNAIGRITWPVILVVVPFAYLLLDKRLLTRVVVNDDGVSTRRFGRTLTTLGEYSVGVFERRAGRRAVAYLYIANASLKVDGAFLRTAKKNTDGFLFLPLSASTAMLVLAFKPDGFCPQGAGDLSEVNTKILTQARKNADILRKSMRA